MGDIVWGVGLITLLSVALFAITLRVSQHIPRATSDYLAGLVVAAMLVYIRCLWYQPQLAKWLPYSNLIVLGNWFPLAAGMLGGLAWHRVPGVIFRKSLSVSALALASGYSLLSPVMHQVPECQDVWTPDGICVQTTARTCTPACAATLLRAYGIETTEQEMAALCLTGEGTSWPGLYRALKRKTDGTPWDVELIACTGDELVANPPFPAILSVGLPAQPTENQQVVMSEWGWKEGVGHSVVLLKTAHHGRVILADPTPSLGREEWRVSDLRMLFRGTAMRLIKRS